MFTHLHTRSAFTMLGSTLKINDIITLAKENHFETLVLTDKNVMHGAMSFYHACKKAQIKPVFGLELSVDFEDKTYNFLCYAKNDLSFISMLKLSTRLNIDGEKISFDEFITYTKEMIVISAMDNDELENMIIKEDDEQLSHFLTVCRDSFFDYYVAISKNDSGLFKVKNKILKNIASSLQISCVAISRVYYAHKEDEFAYKVLCAMKQGILVNDNMLQYSANRYFRSFDEMKELYEEDEIACVNEIISKCNVTMSFEKSKLPSFENKFKVDSSYYLKKLCEKGLEKRMNFQNVPIHYKKRLKYELDIISQMGFSDYFLIVWDFIRYARSQDIYVGPGRGSAAGSLVAYCLGITHVDPIRFDLLFERFLNPERISMPDIDTDFPDNRRDEVIRYVRDKYGDHKVAHIVTFGTLAAKQVLRDVGKAMNVSLRDIDALCKLVPNVPKVTLVSAYEQSPPFKQRIVKSRQLQEVFDIALKLEGLPRHTSIHAGGIVISGKDIESVCPLMKVDGEMFATQYTMEYLEELGLIKMDFLGLRNLTIIDEIVKRIENRTGKKLDVLKLPMHDSRTYSLIAEADTVGVFQLESEGMKNLLKKIKPSCFEDIVACIALFRPGPMENIPDYIFYREHPGNVQYPDESLKSILKNTYGIMIYQEQIIQIAQKMAGFSLGKADILRKAISKKKERELAGLQKDFIEGALQNGYSKDTAQKVYDLIMKFANYGFNRAHSVVYGFLAYQMAYLKANFPLEFFASVLNNVVHSETKTAEYIYEAKKERFRFFRHLLI